MTPELPCITSSGITQGLVGERNTQGYPSVSWGKFPQLSILTVSPNGALFLLNPAFASDFRLWVDVISVEMTELFLSVSHLSSTLSVSFCLCVRPSRSLRTLLIQAVNTSKQDYCSHIQVITPCFSTTKQWLYFSASECYHADDEFQLILILVFQRCIRIE